LSGRAFFKISTVFFLLSPCPASADIATANYIRESILSITGVSIPADGTGPASNSYLMRAIDELNEVSPYSVATNYGTTVSEQRIVATSAVPGAIAAFHNCLGPGGYKSGGACAICSLNYYCPAGTETKISCDTVGAEFVTVNSGASDAASCLPRVLCATENKNLCNAGAACYYVSSGGYIAWDGTKSGNTVIDGKVEHKARPNDYGIRALTWACRQTNTAPSGEAECDGGLFCWCRFSKDPDTEPETFVTGKWSSWVLGYNYTGHSSADNCLTSCAAACTDRVNFATVGGAVQWE
jgi:hypothetical protein